MADGRFCGSSLFPALLPLVLATRRLHHSRHQAARAHLRQVGGPHKGLRPPTVEGTQHTGQFGELMA